MTEDEDEIDAPSKVNLSKSLRRQRASSMAESHRWPMPLTLVQARSLQLCVGFRRRSKIEMVSVAMSYHEAIKRRFRRPDSRQDFTSLKCYYDTCGFRLDFGFCSEEGRISFIFLYRSFLVILLNFASICFF